MPVYEYECEKCGHGFEREQRMSDPPVKTCPACKSRRVRKLISRSSFVLKGGGWYADGYADSRKGAAAEKGEGAGSEGSVAGATAAAKPADSTSKTEPKKAEPVAETKPVSEAPAAKAAPASPAAGQKPARTGKKKSAA